MKIDISPVGWIRCGEDGFSAVIAPEFRDCLTGIEGFSHVQILWWADGCADVETRKTYIESKPYVHGPDVLGVFATRSPRRPNPVMLSNARVTYVDREGGVIGLAYTDANDGTPIIDIKPYTPSLDRAAAAEVPDWCSHWPKSMEESAEFDWESEFNF